MSAVKYDVGRGNVRVLGCSRCAGSNETMDVLGFGPTHVSPSDFHLLGEDAEEKARAMQTCPKCDAKLTKKERFVTGYICKSCGANNSNRNFCTSCGNGMAPHLFDQLTEKNLLPSFAD